MRHDCRYFSSRTFGGGETVQRCELDVAPEAPWRCPDDCALFEKRLMDVGWVHGGMATSADGVEPPGLDGDPADVAALMADLEDIVDGAATDARVEAEQAFVKQQRKEKRRRFFRRGKS